MNKFKRADDAQPLLRIITASLCLVGTLALAIAIMEILR